MMHLHSMTLQAIGPFAGTHTVDFAALGEAGIFLLEGPTGAGKSTLIDAVVFALYGKVASAAASDDRLRSAYATDETESFVDLTFETGAGIFRVVRTPERLRPKKRGEGTTKQQASIKLWALTVEELMAGVGEPGESGRLLSNRLDEAGAELTRIIGLDRSQFVQTIVLPQGEFANFLRANPEDRRGLLQKVFGTEIYEKAQGQLAVMRAGAQQQLTAARSRVTTAVETFITSIALTEEDAQILRAAASHDVPKLADEHVAGLASAAQECARAEAAATLRHAGAREASARARQLADDTARRDGLLAERALLEDQAESMRDLELTLASARRASMVEPAISAEAVASRAAEAATVHLGEALERARAIVDLPAGLGSWEDGAQLDDARAALRRGRDADAGQIALLKRLLPIEAGLPARRAAGTAAMDMLAERRAAVTSLEAVLASRPDERLTLEGARDAVRALAAELPTRMERCSAATEVVETFTRLDALAADHDAALGARSAAASRAKDAVDAEGETRRARIAGIAGEIAAGLEPGDQCPVCGSLEHPEPARRGADHVDQAAVERAEGERRAREDELNAADQLVARLAERLAAVAESVSATDVTSAMAECAAAEEAVAAATAAQEQAVVAQRDLDAFDAETAALRTDHTRLVELVTAEQAHLDHDRSALAADEAEVSAAAGARTVADVVADLTARVDAVDALLASQDEATTAWSRRRERRDELNEALAGNGFDSVDAARAGARPAHQIDEHERELTGYRASVERVRNGLAEERVAALTGTVEVDVDAVRAAEEVSEVAAREAQVAATLARRAVQDGEREAAAIARASAQLEAVEVATDPVIRMADLAGGTSADNATRLTLATFVLMRRFEDVVAAANSRIATMSDGRYELVRSDVKEVKGNTKVGLALRVQDHQTGAQRLPSSLSGGETFYVSLCLALGMADVVTAEAGGVTLGTLFVDEGFGSLDPETLDSVLAILGRLQAGGRVVGVVSHVEALKQTISDGISVRRLADGSSTLTVRAG